MSKICNPWVENLIIWGGIKIININSISDC